MHSVFLFRMLTFAEEGTLACLMHQVRRVDCYSAGAILHNIQHQTNRSHIRYEIRTAVADKRQRYTGDRQDADAHANIFKDMRKKHRHDAHND